MVAFAYPKTFRKPDDAIITVHPPFPDLDVQENGLWELTEKVTIIDRAVVDEDKFRTWTVEPYKDSDLASIPAVGRLVFRTHGTWTIGAVIHDDLYRRRLFPRSYCDDFFRRVIVAYHTPAWKARAMYCALRLNLLADLKWNK